PYFILISLTFIVHYGFIASNEFCKIPIKSLSEKGLELIETLRQNKTTTLNTKFNISSTFEQIYENVFKDLYGKYFSSIVTTPQIKLLNEANKYYVVPSVNISWEVKNPSNESNLKIIDQMNSLTLEGLFRATAKDSKLEDYLDTQSIHDCNGTTIEIIECNSTQTKTECKEFQCKLNITCEKNENTTTRKPTAEPTKDMSKTSTNLVSLSTSTKFPEPNNTLLYGSIIIEQFCSLPIKNSIKGEEFILTLQSNKTFIELYKFDIYESLKKLYENIFRDLFGTKLNSLNVTNVKVEFDVINAVYKIKPILNVSWSIFLPNETINDLISIINKTDIRPSFFKYFNQSGLQEFIITTDKSLCELEDFSGFECSIQSGSCNPLVRTTATQILSTTTISTRTSSTNTSTSKFSLPFSTSTEPSSISQQTSLISYSITQSSSSDSTGLSTTRFSTLSSSLTSETQSSSSSSTVPSKFSSSSASQTQFSSSSSNIFSTFGTSSTLGTKSSSSFNSTQFSTLSSFPTSATQSSSSNSTVPSKFSSSSASRTQLSSSSSNIFSTFGTSSTSATVTQSLSTFSTVSSVPSSVSTSPNRNSTISVTTPQTLSSSSSRTTPVVTISSTTRPITQTTQRPVPITIDSTGFYYIIINFIIVHICPLSNNNIGLIQEFNQNNFVYLNSTFMLQTYYFDFVFRVFDNLRCIFYDLPSFDEIFFQKIRNNGTCIDVGLIINFLIDNRNFTNDENLAKLIVSNNFLSLNLTYISHDMTEPIWINENATINQTRCSSNSFNQTNECTTCIAKLTDRENCPGSSVKNSLVQIVNENLEKNLNLTEPLKIISPTVANMTKYKVTGSNYTIIRTNDSSLVNILNTQRFVSRALNPILENINSMIIKNLRMSMGNILDSVDGTRFTKKGPSPQFPGFTEYFMSSNFNFMRTNETYDENDLIILQSLLSQAIIRINFVQVFQNTPLTFNRINNESVQFDWQLCYTKSIANSDFCQVCQSNSMSNNFDCSITKSVSVNTTHNFMVTDAVYFNYNSTELSLSNDINNIIIGQNLKPKDILLRYYLQVQLYEVLKKYLQQNDNIFISVQFKSDLKNSNLIWTNFYIELTNQNFSDIYLTQALFQQTFQSINFVEFFWPEGRLNMSSQVSIKQNFCINSVCKTCDSFFGRLDQATCSCSVEENLKSRRKRSLSKELNNDFETTLNDENEKEETSKMTTQLPTPTFGITKKQETEPNLLNIISTLAKTTTSIEPFFSTTDEEQDNKETSSTTLNRITSKDPNLAITINIDDEKPTQISSTVLAKTTTRDGSISNRVSLPDLISRIPILTTTTTDQDLTSDYSTYYDEYNTEKTSSFQFSSSTLRTQITKSTSDNNLDLTKSQIFETDEINLIATLQTNSSSSKKTTTNPEFTTNEVDFLTDYSTTNEEDIQTSSTKKSVLTSSLPTVIVLSSSSKPKTTQSLSTTSTSRKTSTNNDITDYENTEDLEIITDVLINTKSSNAITLSSTKKLSQQPTRIAEISTTNTQFTDYEYYTEIITEIVDYSDYDTVTELTDSEYLIETVASTQKPMISSSKSSSTGTLKTSSLSSSLSTFLPITPPKCLVYSNRKTNVTLNNLFLISLSNIPNINGTLSIFEDMIKLIVFDPLGVVAKNNNFMKIRFNFKEKMVESTIDLAFVPLKNKASFDLHLLVINTFKSINLTSAFRIINLPITYNQTSLIEQTYCDNQNKCSKCTSVFSDNSRIDCF
ncbi:unnamed protein product, partial [Brachionus calyciflorus]